MFENIIGNEKNKKILSKIISPSHAYMFIGESGIGKFLFAKEFAKKILCLSENKPCGNCKSCLQFETSNNMDFKVIEPVKDNISVEQIREDLIKNSYEKPIISSKKVYIINDADKMSLSAQNALLKVLEEPPIYVTMFLIGSNENLFINTIHSRCIKIKFNNITNDELERYISLNNININKNLLSACNGSIGKIRKIQEFEEDYSNLLNVFSKIEEMNTVEIYKNMTNVIKKENIIEMLEYLNILMYEKIIYDKRYIGCVEEVNNALNLLRGNCNFEMIKDQLIFKICEKIK